MKNNRLGVNYSICEFRLIAYIAKSTFCPCVRFILLSFYFNSICPCFYILLCITMIFFETDICFFE
jgi:hypothetical protein